MKTCVVIPTYNEAKEIGNLVRKLRSSNLEVLVIDDGSSDATAQIARQADAMVIKNAQNQGKGASLIKGFDFVLKNGFDAVLTMDGDGQHNPDDVKYFFDAMKTKDAGVFVGNRMHKAKGMPFIRWLTNKFMSLLISFLCKQRIADSQCGFRLIKREVLEKIRLKSMKYEIESEIIIKAARHGFKIASVDIESIYKGEKSQINPFLDTIRFFKFLMREIWMTQH
ncbi:MAG: glycosyltransferase family 2 protein [Candidatus Omnitrophica bacterium]|nr:glycosyltransferase family 2 protein [Candidatus Omnitrophota bacterium]